MWIIVSLQHDFRRWQKDLTLMDVSFELTQGDNEERDVVWLLSVSATESVMPFVVW